MLSFTSRFGRKLNRRLNQEKVIWLTTTEAGIKDLGMTVPQFTASFGIPILITPRSMRGY